MAHAFALSLACLASHSHAAPCDGAPVLLELNLENLPEEDRRETHQQLRAGLSDQCIELAEPGQGKKVVASLRISSTEALRTKLRLQISDEVTQKFVERELDLTSFSKEARPLAVSVAAEELLAASWAELLLTEQRPQETAPPPVARMVEKKLSEPPTHLRFALAGRTELVRLNELRVGGEGSLLVHFGSGPFFQGSIAYVTSPLESIPSGAVQASNLAGALGGGYRFSFQRLELESSLLLRVGVETLRFETAQTTLIPLTQSGPTLHAELNLGVGFRFSEAFRTAILVGAGPVLVGLAGLAPDAHAIGLRDSLATSTLRLEFLR